MRNRNPPAPEERVVRSSGPNRRAFLLGALRALARDLEARGGRLLVREGDPVTVIPALARELDAATVWCSQEYTPYARRRDTAVERALRADGRTLHPMPGIYLSDFDEIRKADGDPYRIYSPFAPAAKEAAWDDPLPAPRRVPVPDVTGASHPGPDGIDLDGAVETTPPDPEAALERLRWFAERRVDGYGRSRNSMAIDGTSRLSPYLRFGLISPRQVAATVGRFEFEDDPEGLAAWREGRTGYPLVDAGMRQLTGQVAGSGTDAAPFYRIFNPVTQAEKFDPDGDYIRRWVPELSKLDPPAIFAPWQAAPADLEKPASASARTTRTRSSTT